MKKVFKRVDQRTETQMERIVGRSLRKTPTLNQISSILIHWDTLEGKSDL